MAIRLLPASVDPPDSSGPSSTSLVLANRSALATWVNPRSSPEDTYAWSASTGRGGADWDSQSEDASADMGDSAWNYVSESAWSVASALTAAAHYLLYAAMFTAGSGQLVDVYA